MDLPNSIFICMLGAVAAASSCDHNFQRNPEKGPLGSTCELTSPAAPRGDASLCYAMIDLHSYREEDTLPGTVLNTISAKFEALRRVGTQPLVRRVSCPQLHVCQGLLATLS